MLEKYKSLAFKSLADNPKCIVPDRGYKELSLEDPAIAVMTDHRIERAPTCSADRALDRAMKQMAEENCNMLLITNEDGDITGLVTSADITGEKPIQYTKESGKKRDEIRVRHLMTHIQDIPALSIKDVLDSKIGDILHTLNEIGSEYVLVTGQEQGDTAVRGVFSARSIARSLKIFFDPSPAARTFAEFTKALHGNELTH